MAKGIAIHALVVVAIIGMLIFFGLIVFWTWLNWTTIENSKLACTIKFKNYCTEWFKKNYQEEPYNWNDMNPKDCDQFQIKKPSSKDECTK